MGKVNRSCRTRTKKKDDLFFMYLANTGSVVKACEGAGYTRSRVYQLRHDDPLFNNRWLRATGDAVGLVEDSLLDVLVNGDTDYKILNYTVDGVKQSERVEIKRHYPSAMLGFMKSRDSERYSAPVVQDDEFKHLSSDERKQKIRELMEDIENISSHVLKD